MKTEQIKEYWKKATGNGYPINYIDPITSTEMVFKVTEPGKAFICFMGATSFTDFFLSITGLTKIKFSRAWLWIKDKIEENNITEIECVVYSQGTDPAARLYKKLEHSGIGLNFLFFGGYKTIEVPITNIVYKKDIVGKWPFFKKQTYKNYYLDCDIPWYKFKKIHEYYREEFSGC